MRGRPPVFIVSLRLLGNVAGALAALGARAEGPMRTRWLAPWYRDTVYASQRLRETELLVTVAGTAEELSGYGLYAEVVGDTAGTFWSQLRRQRDRPVETENSLPLDANRMADGEHVVRLVLFDREEQRLLGETRTALRKLPAAPVEVCPSKSGVLLVNGAPTFPVAVATSLLAREDVARFAEAGVSLAVDTGKPAPDRIERLLRSTAAAGIRLVAPFPRRLLTGDDDATAREALKAYESTGGLLAWHGCPPDAPLSQPDFDRFVDRSPYRPLLSVADTPSVEEARADIVAVSPSLRRRRAYLQSKSIARWADAIHQRTAQGLPTWGAIPLRLVWDGKGPDPMRTMAWLAVARGAQGVLFDDEGHEDLLRPGHACWGRVARVSAELHLARLTLAEGTARPIEVTGTQALAMAARYHGFRWLVVAANPTAETVTADLSSPDMCAGTALRVLSESRTVVTQSSGEGGGNAGFTDSFGPYEVHVYTNRAPPGE